MPRAKRWDELTRRQRREVRAYLRWCIKNLMQPTFAANLRAALRELREPKGDGDE